MVGIARLVRDQAGMGGPSRIAYPGALTACSMGRARAAWPSPPVCRWLPWSHAIATLFPGRQDERTRMALPAGGTGFQSSVRALAGSNRSRLFIVGGGARYRLLHCEEPCPPKWARKSVERHDYCTISCVCWQIELPADWLPSGKRVSGNCPVDNGTRRCGAVCYAKIGCPTGCGAA